MNALTYQQTGLTYGLNQGDSNYIQVDPFKSLTSPNKGLVFPSSNMIILQPRTANFQPSTLGNTTHVYTSPSYSDIIALSNYFADWGCSYSTLEGGVHTITVQIPWDTLSSQDFYVSSYVSEQFEIVPNMNAKSIITNGLLANPFTPPTVTGNYVVLPDTLKIAVQRAYDNKTLTITVPTGSFTSSIAPWIPYAQLTLNYLRGGVESVPSYTQTVKRTAVVDNRNTNRAFQRAVDAERASLNAAGTINYLYSTQDLISKFDIPYDSVAKFLMPSYSKYISVTGIDAMTYRVYSGWMVKQPTIQFVTRNKAQMTQEFIWDEYISGLYYISSPSSHFPFVSNPASNPSGFAP